MALADYGSLAKPRVTAMVVITAGLGLYLAPTTIGGLRASLAVLGIALLVAGANALNMYLERDIDGLAARTKERPLPAGRLHPRQALIFGGVLCGVSLPCLWVGGNALTGMLGILSLVLYVAAYTPLKQISPGALVVGAIPGAAPPLMGWTAATGQLDLGGLTLFAILFLWQLPHFLAISLYRRPEYERAGYRLTVSEHGVSTAKFQIVLYLLALWPVTLLLVPLGVGHTLYLVFAVPLGLLFFFVGLLGLRKGAGLRWARSLFSTSLVYLVVLMGALLLDHAITPAAPETALGHLTWEQN